MQFKFSTDGEGNYGYLGADDSFIPFLNLMSLNTFEKYISYTTSSSVQNVDKDGIYIVVTYSHAGSCTIQLNGIHESCILAYQTGSIYVNVCAKPLKKGSTIQLGNNTGSYVVFRLTQ